jgi:hypothetical protein
MNTLFTEDLFFREEEIKAELKCSVCLNIYEDPRILPCGDSVCFACITINKNTSIENCLVKNSIKCAVCEEYVNIKRVDDLPKNKALAKLINKKANTVYRNKSVEELKENLKKILSRVEQLQNDLKHPNHIIKSHFASLKRQVDLDAEKAKQAIDSIRENLLKEVDKHEKDTNITLATNINYQNEKLKLEQILAEINQFVVNRVNYLKQYEIDDKEIAESIQQSKRKLFELENHTNLFQNFILGSGLIKYVPNESDFASTMKKILGKIVKSHENTSNIDSVADLSHFDTLTRIPSKIQVTHSIWTVDALPNSNIIIISSDLSSIYANLIQVNGDLLKQNLISRNEFSLFTNLSISSCTHSNRVLLSVFYNSLCQIYLLDNELNILAYLNKIDWCKITDCALTMPKCYVLMLKNNKHHVAILDQQLNQVVTRGKKALKQSDPFFFSFDIRKINVHNEKIFILEREYFKIMNEVTGQIELSFAVMGNTFSLFKQNFLLTLDAGGNINYYELRNGKNILRLKMLNESKAIYTKRLSNNTIFVFSRYSNYQFMMLN